MCYGNASDSLVQLACCWLNPAMGGAEVFTREVTKRWAKAGHEVTLFTSELVYSLVKEQRNV